MRITSYLAYIRPPLAGWPGSIVVFVLKQLTVPYISCPSLCLAVSSSCRLLMVACIDLMSIVVPRRLE
jgi:hypothetical protein